jgi:hypothetical protein
LKQQSTYFRKLKIDIVKNRKEKNNQLEVLN